MKRPPPSSQGYSLIEILVVLAILGILSAAGVAMIGNRSNTAVRSLTDELEGALVNARQSAVATGRDTLVISYGSWAAATPAVVAFGDATTGSTAIQTLANGLLAGTPPAGVAYAQSIGAPFHYLANDSTHLRARIFVKGADDWTNANLPTSSGGQNQGLQNVDPFLSGTGFKGMVVDAGGKLVDANNFFSGALNQVTVGGSSQRFDTTFYIMVVGTSPGGGALPGAPMGLLFVQAGGASIFKFYNPGAKAGDGKWRRI